METLIKKQTKILILQTAFLGDVLLTLPLIHHLRKIFSDSEIDLIVRPDAAEVSEISCDLNRVIIFDKKKNGLRNTFNLIKAIRKKKYDLLISPHRSYRSSLISFFSGIPKRIGFDTASFSILYSDKVKYQKNVHEVERNISLISEFRKVQEWEQLIPIKPSAAELHKKLISWNNSKQQIVCIAPFSEWYTKRYPQDYFIKLIELLIKSEIKVLIIGGKKDLSDSNKIVESISSSECVLNLTGQLSIRESIDVIGKCNLLISNDSAPTHMAMFTTCPVLTIYGSTIPGFGFYPYRSFDSVIQIDELYCKPCGIHGFITCPENHFRCMRELKPELVFEQVKKMLQNEIISL
ncbi:MAG: lipopolysaccharide heptosyltransferase II [Ignavibacteria bacterium]|nr:lipopolysaccharide heptosyltransferase II [Ignavibacteria bacterium]